MSAAGSTVLDQKAVAAIRRHMNTDHLADNLAIVLHHGAVDGAVAAEVVAIDEDGITFEVIDGAGERHRVVIAWSGPIAERADVRRELVRLTEAALAADASSPTTDHPTPHTEETS